MAAHLKPKLLTSTEDFKNKILYADIETIIVNNIHVPIALGYSNFNGINSNVYFTKYSSPNIKSDFNHHLIKFLKVNKDSIVYFHNLSKFDGYILLKHLHILFPAKFIKFTERNNKIYKITIKSLNIQIKDSFLLLPESLTKIGYSFNLFYKKLHFNYNSNSLFWKSKTFKLKLLLKNDILCLQEGLGIFSYSLNKSFLLNCHAYLSLPSVTLDIFRNKFYVNSLISKNDFYKDIYLRESYQGGASDLFLPFVKYGYFYDLNSLYPRMMCNDMPAGNGKFLVKTDKISLINFFGFLEVIISTPKKSYSPVLTKKDFFKGNLNPIGVWKGLYFSEELKVARSLGYKFQIIKSVQYNRGKIFKQYIIFLYNIRTLFSKNIPLNNILKLLLNSLYGRFGMKTLKIQKDIVNYVQLNKLKNKFIIHSINFLSKNKLIVSYDDKRTFDNFKQKFAKSLNTNTAVHIASATTSYSRLAIYTFKSIPHNCCIYSDTDSVFLSKKLSKVKISKKLGYMKKINYFKIAYFLSIKCYFYLTFHNTKVIKIKGLPILEKEKLNHNFFFNVLKTQKDFQFAYNRTDLFVKKFASLDVFSRTLLINFKIPFNKRVKVYKNNFWIQTKAVKINGLFRKPHTF